MILFYTGIFETIGANLGLTGPTQWPGEQMLASVVATNKGKTLSVYVDKSIYQTITTYMTNLVNHTPGQETTFPEFTPAEQTMLMLYTTIIDQVKHGKFRGVNLDPNMRNVILVYMHSLINNKLDQERTFPEFTPMELTIISLFTTLMEKQSI